MKRNIFFLSLVLTLFISSCEDYLDVKSESRFDSDFIFQSESEADKAVLGAYELLRSSSGIHSNHLFYDQICVQSDIEVGPEPPAFGGRYTPMNCYNATPQLSDIPISSWNGMYTTINRCNILIEAFESNDAFINANKNEPSGLTHLYGEAVAIRATMYYELTRCWGDVIYSLTPITSKADYEGLSLTDRNEIQEDQINLLIEIEPMMYRLNSSGNRTAERMTREYVQGLIARMALLRGGFALRPPSYSGDGEVIQTHPEWGKMVRRSDYKNYYTIANTYLKKLVNEGNARLVTTDPRTPSEKYSNPFQYHFQYSMSNQISPEMIWEVSELAGTSTERPYAFGRPSDGGSTAYPPKAYGQIRFFPTYYYGMFHNKDLRRDITVAVTALGGVANEKIMSLKKGNKSQGGLSLNKWDYCRMADKTYAVRQRQSGVNAPYMRLADMILLLAETASVLGDDASARAELLKIRERAFNPDDPDYNSLTSGYVNALSGNALLEAIQDERAMELGGEGVRKYDLARWGIMGKKINQLQNQMETMINALETNGYYEFPNGNVISTYIYVKPNTLANSGLAEILTTTCYVDSTNALYPLLFPGWRGTFTEWDAPSSVTLKKEILAIKGLFERISDPWAATLVAQGYKKTKWGVDLIDDTYRAKQVGIFGGYLPDAFAANYPPRYILPIPATTISYSGGMISNSYGFPNE